MIAVWRMPLLRLMRLAAIFAAGAVGFAVACLVGSRILPPPELPNVVREKTAHLAARGNEYDAIFLGSSRIQNHIMPDLFDRLMAANGVPMRSFNFGVFNLYAPEDDYVLDLILSQPHARLRWVFVEVDFFDASVHNGETGTLRALYWHDLPRFLLLCKCLALTKDAGFRGFRRDGSAAIVRGRDFLEHAQIFFQRSVNLGRGSKLLKEWLFGMPPSLSDPAALGKAGDGWSPSLPTPSTLADMQSGQLEKELKNRIANPPTKEEGDPASQDVLAGMLAKISAAGATPVLLLSPRVRQRYFYPNPALAARYPIIDLCQPGRFPDLYRADLRIDRSHLNARGAEIFTRVVVEQFLPTALHK